MNLADRSIAYFSMEVGLEPSIPTYSGGLGGLAGDTLRAAADLRVPMVGVSLVHRRGYMRQSLSADGTQSEAPSPWNPEELLEDTGIRVPIPLGSRTVTLRVWKYEVLGADRHIVPVYLLDAELPENDAEGQRLTDHLYGGDAAYRLAQEIVLGMGGVAALRALGLENIRTFHMNEGHSALLTLALLKEQLHLNVADGHARELTESAIDGVRSRCVFTTHTPVPAGHDKFDWGLAGQLLSDADVELLRRAEVAGNDHLNLTRLALNLSHFVNGVAMRHGASSRELFPGYPVNSITNGVHPLAWTSEPFRNLFDWHIPEWRRSAVALRHAVGIPIPEVVDAHEQAKRRLMAELQRRCGERLSPSAFTIGFARRAAEYKRPGLLFSDLDRLRAINRQLGPIQIVYAGKAHPMDSGGKESIRKVHEASQALRGEIPVVWVEDYDMTLAGFITSGVDLWLNTPLRPLEASGTSGMKAALNGVPSLSVLDGWWIEGHIEGVTGWSIGANWRPALEDHGMHDADSLYEKLETAILPAFRQPPEVYGRIMRSTVAFNASFFNAHRMMQEYQENAYRHGEPATH